MTNFTISFTSGWVSNGLAVLHTPTAAGRLSIKNYNGSNPVTTSFSIHGVMIVDLDVEDQCDIENQAEEVEQTVGEISDEPEASSSMDTLGPHLPGMQTNAVYFGEQIHSWRSVLKRYCVSGRYQGSSLDLAWWEDFHVPVFGQALPVVGLIPKDFIASAYLARRGASRIKLLQVDGGTGGPIHAMISRMSARNEGLATGGAFLGTQPYNSPNWNGSSWQPMHLTGCVDAELPYYFPLRFIPARAFNRSAYTPDDVLRGLGKIHAHIHVRAATSVTLDVAQSVGEDYSLYMFVSAPILYDSSPPPLNPPFG